MYSRFVDVGAVTCRDMVGATTGVFLRVRPFMYRRLCGTLVYESMFVWDGAVNGDDLVARAPVWDGAISSPVALMSIFSGVSTS